jgi:hypothetical protein
VIAIFGATGAAGDGILKAALVDPGVTKIHVITRRTTPRIDAGVANGRVVLKTHADYLDYAPLKAVLKDVDAIYWALGTSSVNVTKDAYTTIHIDYPVACAKTWLAAHSDTDLAFHFVSGAGAGLDKRAHWAREKARAEQALFKLAEGTRLRAVSFRPGYIAPAEEKANALHNLAHAIFKPLKLAIRSTALGEAMLEAVNIASGTILEMSEIVPLATAYQARRSS